MTTAPKMQEFILRLLEKHGCDLSKRPLYLRIEIESELPLVIHSHAGDYIHIAQVDESCDRFEDDWSITLYIGQSEWIPTLICTQTEPARYFSRPTRDGHSVEVLDKNNQALLVDDCEKWADQLQQQGWIEKGRRWKS